MDLAGTIKELPWLREHGDGFPQSSKGRLLVIIVRRGPREPMPAANRLFGRCWHAPRRVGTALGCAGGRHGVELGQYDVGANEACIVTSVAAVITLDHLVLNGELLVEARPPSLFHNLLGPPSRIFAAGPPAPYGHRNSQIHVYDSLGIFLNEHHYTYAIEAVSFVCALRNPISA